MKKLLVPVLCLMLTVTVFALDGTQADESKPAIISKDGIKTLDEQSDQGVIVSPQDPVITSILERMDGAKSNGDDALFRQLLNEYKELNPAITVEEGPQALTGKSETKTRWIDNDIEIDTAFNFQGLSMDTRNGTTIYIAASREVTSGDENTIPIWSSDDGIAWTQIYNLNWAGHEFYNPSLKIVETPDTDYIFVAFQDYRISTTDYDIMVFRANLVSAAYDFFYPASNDSFAEMDPSLDADDLAYPTVPYLHLAFESGDSIAYMRSVDRGETWTDRVILGAGGTTYNYYDPSIAYGAATPASDSMNLGVAWAYYQASPRFERIRFRKNFHKGETDSWSTTEYFSAPDNCFDNRPSLKMTHGTMNSATIVFARRDTTTDQEDLWNTYTYDAGRTWEEDELYGGGNYEVLTTLAVDDSPNDYHVFFKGDYDDVRYKEAHYNDFTYDGWTWSIGISDTTAAGGEVSDVTPPASAVLGEDPCVCWKTHTGSVWSLRFDALWLLSGIDVPDDNVISLLDASPAVFTNQTDISYSLSGGQNITLDIYDALGRSVKTLASGAKPAGSHSVTWNGENDKGEPLSSGIYFCVLKAGNNKTSKKITLIK